MRSTVVYTDPFAHSNSEIESFQHLEDTVRFAPLLLALLSPQAFGFCGTYIGSAGAELYNHKSQVVFVRQGDTTTLTVGIDYDGDLEDFALVIPVPQVLRERHVSIADGDLIARMDAYSSPRLVEYSCDDMWVADSATYGTSAACGASPQPAQVEEAGGVTIESSFSAGEYEIEVLSAEQSGGLMQWLDSNGYSVPASSADLLQEYIDADQYFLAAKVNVRQAGRQALSPLRFEYESDAMGLPIRIGTLSSPGEQDVLIYAVTGPEVGRLGISNYPEITLEDECMADVGPDGLGAFYEQQFASAVAEHGAAWTVEYSWSPVKCDPCTSEPLDTTNLRDAGWTGPLEDAHFTRIHMRYGKGDVDQDLALYGSGLRDQSQIRYIDHRDELEEWLPVCGLGMVDNPGTCSAGDDQSASLGPLWLGWLVLLPLGLRRRSRD